MRRNGHGRELPPPLELECLRVLWAIREGTVRDVRAVILEKKPLAYTTVMTLLDRLVRKGGVTRRKVGRSFLYAPVYDREVLRRSAVNELVRSFFDGSEEALVEYLERANGEKVMSVAAGASAEERLDTALL